LLYYSIGLLKKEGDGDGTEEEALHGNKKRDFFFKERLNCNKYEGWNFNSGNYLFTTDTK